MDQGQENLEALTVAKHGNSGSEDNYLDDWESGSVYPHLRLHSQAQIGAFLESGGEHTVAKVR